MIHAYQNLTLVSATVLKQRANSRCLGNIRDTLHCKWRNHLYDLLDKDTMNKHNIRANHCNILRLSPLVQQ